MSIFASYVSKVVALPFDPPNEVTIQKLSGKHLAAARQAQIAASFEQVRTMGGAAAFQNDLAAIGESVSTAIAAEQAARKADPMRQYDRGTLLAHGIKAWTYTEAITPATLDDLDEQAADFLAREILALTMPNGNAEKKTDS